MTEYRVSEDEFVERGMKVVEKVKQDQAEYRRVMGIPRVTWQLSEHELTLLMTATAGAIWGAESAGMDERAAELRMLNKRISDALSELLGTDAVMEETS